MVPQHKSAGIFIERVVLTLLLGVTLSQFTTRVREDLEHVFYQAAFVDLETCS